MSYTLADVGCATGYYIRFLCPEVPIEYTGSDYNQDSIDLARAHYPGVAIPDVRRYEPVRHVGHRDTGPEGAPQTLRLFGFLGGDWSIKLSPKNERVSWDPLGRRARFFIEQCWGTSWRTTR